MKALKYIFFILTGLAVLFLLAALFARHDYHIERTIEIEAPREIVYDQVRFFKNAPNWSPWLYLDPKVQTSIEGTDGEAGAVYKWKGNKAIGEGSQTLKSVTPERVDLIIAYNEFGVSPSCFAFSEKEDKTTVIWAMDMYVPFPWNAFSMLTDMNNSFIGKDFANGLANLKKYCETLAPKKYRGYEVKEMELPATNYVTIRQVVDFQNIEPFLSEHFPQIEEAITKAGAKTSGYPSGFYWTYDTLTQKTDMAAAIQIPLDKPVKMGPEVQIVSTGGKALVIDYLGDFAKSADAHGAMDDYMADKKLQYVPPVIEEYITNTTQEPDTAKWHMKVIYFITAKVDTVATDKKD